MLVELFETDGSDHRLLSAPTAHQLVEKYGVAEDGSCVRDFNPDDPLLRNYLTKCINISPALEAALTRIRRETLFSLLDSISRTAADLATIIALQSFNNEYLHYCDAEETSTVATLRLKLEGWFSSGNSVEMLEPKLLAFAMYRPLSEIAGAADQVDFLERHGFINLRSVIRVTLRDAEEEKNMESSISSFSEINDETSRNVRTQYEEHPYPRWLHIPRTSPVDLPKQLKEKFPYFSQAEALKNPQTILIAGCGTGRHAASVAMQWPQANILAIDLSKRSIAYAMRKAKELNISNIRFRHGDIMEAHRLKGPFDMVQSVGVLHHMKDPLAG